MPLLLSSKLLHTLSFPPGFLTVSSCCFFLFCWTLSRCSASRPTAWYCSIDTHPLGDLTQSRLKPSLGQWLSNVCLQSGASPRLQTHTNSCQLDISTRISNRHLKLKCLKQNSSTLPPSLLFCKFFYLVYGTFILPTIWAPNLEASPTPIFLSHLISDS